MEMLPDAVDPFRIRITDAVLDDLAARLGRLRLPSPPVPGGGEAAGSIRRIEELIAYWRDDYDWPAQERRLNAFPHYRATVDGVGIHFIHAPGTGPDPLPLVLSNGWPSSFTEYLGVLGPLADPAAHGGDPADSFSVVVPALPGYGFSDRCLERPGLPRPATRRRPDHQRGDLLGHRDNRQLHPALCAILGPAAGPGDLITAPASALVANEKLMLLRRIRTS